MENFSNLDRREFLTATAGAAVAFGCGGCFSLKHRNAALEAAMCKYVDDKFFGGIVLASQIAGKEKTMGPRMHLLELMAN